MYGYNQQRFLCTTTENELHLKFVEGEVFTSCATWTAEVLLMASMDDRLPGTSAGMLM